MNRSKHYMSRRAAVAAARNACRRLLDAPHYQAFEGPDYGIHPDYARDEAGYALLWEERFFYELRGPALDAHAAVAATA